MATIHFSLAHPPLPNAVLEKLVVQINGTDALELDPIDSYLVRWRMQGRLMLCPGIQKSQSQQP